MSDLTDAYDLAIKKMTEGGVLPPKALEGGDGEITSSRIMQSLRDRFMDYIPGLTREGSEMRGYTDRRIVKDIQKFDDMVGLNDVIRPLAEAVEETMAAVRQRPAWQASGRAGHAQEQPRGRPDIHDALDRATEAMFKEGIMWSQCCGNDKAPLLPYYMQIGTSLRLLKSIPGFDIGNGIDEYDRKLVGQIHEFNEMAGLKDIRRIMDAAANDIYEKIGLKSPETIPVTRPLQFRPKA